MIFFLSSKLLWMILFPDLVGDITSCFYPDWFRRAWLAFDGFWFLLHSKLCCWSQFLSRCVISSLVFI
jgi:hypothetical protein